MAHNKPIQSVSKIVDETAHPQSIPPDKYSAGIGIYNTNIYQNSRTVHTYKKPTITFEPPIPESDSEDEENKTANSKDDNSVRSSFKKKPPPSPNNPAGVRAIRFDPRAYDNNAFLRNEGHFQRGNVNSVMSSVHSLEVQREQYCCFARWSPFERKLALSVGILASVIVGLTITVGLIVWGSDDNSQATASADRLVAWRF